jgi:hypothetical protein
MKTSGRLRTPSMPHSPLRRSDTHMYTLACVLARCQPGTPLPHPQPGLGSPRLHLQDTIRSELRAELGAIAERLAAAEAELPEALHAAADTRALAVAVAALRTEQEEACAAVVQRVSESAAAFAEQVTVNSRHRGRLVFRIVRAVGSSRWLVQRLRNCGCGCRARRPRYRVSAVCPSHARPRHRRAWQLRARRRRCRECTA